MMHLALEAAVGAAVGVTGRVSLMTLMVWRKEWEEGREGWVVRHRITVMGLAVRTGSLQNVASSSPQGLLGTSVSDWQPRSLHRLTEVWLRPVRRSPLPTNTFPACVGLNRLICCL